MPADECFVYLDYNATTPVAPEIAERVLDALKHNWGNPSSMHPLGLSARELLTEARKQVAELLKCSPSEVIFTSGATEANRLALWSAWWGRSTGKRRIVVSAIEHSSVLEAARGLSAFGAEVVLCPVDRRGVIKLDRLEELCTPETALVAVMAANNEIGTLQPIEGVREAAKRAGAYVLCDAVQAAGKVAFSFEASGCHYATVSAHKLYGPKGAGALIARNGVPLRPFLKASDQEKGVRPGTENVPGIVGFGEACRLAVKSADRFWQLARLRDQLEQELENSCGAVVVGKEAERLPTTSGLLFEGVEGRVLAVRLARRGIFAATGSACHSQRVEPSHVLRAMGISARRAMGFLRLSLGLPTTREEIERAAEAIAEEVKAVRRRRR